MEQMQQRISSLLIVHLVILCREQLSKKSLESGICADKTALFYVP
jgi:hypothetical protein